MDGHMDTADVQVCIFVSRICMALMCFCVIDNMQPKQVTWLREPMSSILNSIKKDRTQCRF